MKKSHYLSLVLLAGVLAVVEAASRFIFPVPAFENFNRVAYSPTYSNIAKSANAYLRHDSFVIPSEPDAIQATYELNMYGFRDRDWAPHGDSPRVMFVGDSFVEGYLADASHTIPYGFDAAAQKNGARVETMNFGVTGAGFQEYIQLIYDAVPLFQPQDVVLVLFANDPPTLIFDPTTIAPTPFKRSTPFLPRIADTFVRAVHHDRIALAGHRPPMPYFQPVPSPGNPWTRLEGRYGFVQPEFAAAMKAGKMNPFLTDEINWYYHMLVRPIDAKPVLTVINDFLRAHQVRLFVVYIPARHQITTSYREYAQAFCAPDKLYDLTADKYQVHAVALKQAADELQIPFMDLTAHLREREAAGKRMYLLYDGHFNKNTYVETGEQIYAWWAKHPAATVTAPAGLPPAKE